MVSNKKGKLIEDASAWNSTQLANHPNWIYTFTDDDIEELNAALHLNHHTAIESITKQSFPLPMLSKTIHTIFLPQLENGIGTLLIKGLPIFNYSDIALKKIFKGLGQHFGTLLYQTVSGELLHDVKDAGVTRNHPQARGTNGAWALGFHNDPCDVAALLCVRQARQGGVSKIVSSSKIHNIMLTQYPTLLEELYKPFHTLKHRSQPNLSATYTSRPIFAFEQGYFCCNILRRYIDLAQQEPNIPKLTVKQVEALNMFEQLADSNELCYQFYLEPGDIWFVNNYSTLHARGAFDDSADLAHSRLLLRLWLSVTNSRPLPASYLPIYRNIQAGAIRGGYEVDALNK